MSLYCYIYPQASRYSLKAEGVLEFKLGNNKNCGETRRRKQVEDAGKSERERLIWCWEDGCDLEDHEVHALMRHKQIKRDGGREWFELHSRSFNLELAIKELSNQLDILTGKKAWMDMEFRNGPKRVGIIPQEQRLIQSVEKKIYILDDERSRVKREQKHKEYIRNLRSL